MKEFLRSFLAATVLVVSSVVWAQSPSYDLDRTHGYRVYSGEDVDTVLNEFWGQFSRFNGQSVNWHLKTVRAPVREVSILLARSLGGFQLGVFMSPNTSYSEFRELLPGDLRVPWKMKSLTLSNDQREMFLRLASSQREILLKMIFNRNRDLQSIDYSVLTLRPSGSWVTVPGVSFSADRSH